MTPSAVATNQQLAKIFERQGLLPSDVLEKLQGKARTLQEWLGQVAVDDRFLSFPEVAHAIAREIKAPYMSLKSTAPDFRSLEMVPQETCLVNGVIPTGVDHTTLYLTMANPLDEAAKRSIGNLCQRDISAAVAPLDEITEMTTIWYTQLTEQQKASANGQIPSYFQRAASAVSSTFDQQSLATDPELLTIDELLAVMVENQASDLHLAVGSPPIIRVHGELRPMPYSILTPNAVQTMLYAILTDVQITQFERHWELDLAYSLPGVSRFRVNIHRQRGSIGGVLRTIPVEIPTLEKLKMPAVIQELTQRPRGMVLVTGPTGSGKSTTLAAMIDEINRTCQTHIVTIEDPIEFLHKNKSSVITQREVGADTESFTIALRHVLRQDPDVILIGEMRDLETIAAALTAAETGHLVFATLHTTSAAQTIDRIIDVFPPHQQEQIRSQLASVLEGIITQTLLPNIDGKGRSCAQEILTATPAIRTLIREGKGHQITSVLQASAKYGMQTLDASLKALVLGRKVTLEEAVKKSSNPEDFKALVAMQ